MGQYSSINFSSPAGADPLGIGVPDLGKSTYDPIATIRSGFAQSHKEALLDEQRRYNAYQNFVSKLKPFQAVNAKVGSMLNKEMIDLSRLAYKQYMAGKWSPVTFKKGQESIDAEMSRKENELIQKGQRYNTMLAQYKKWHDFVSDPKNAELIDKKLTGERFQKFTEAGDINSMEEAIREGLVVLKPKPLEMSKWLVDAIKTYAPDYKKFTEKVGTDPETGQIIFKDVSEKDVPAMINAITKKYRLSKTGGEDPRYASYIDQQYADAPSYEKKVGGITLTPPEWFAKKFLPEYPTQEKLRTTSQSSAAAKKNIVKKIIPENPLKTTTIPVQTNFTVKTMETKEPGAIGKIFGKEAKNEEVVSTQSEKLPYEFKGVINLSAAYDKPFQAYVGSNVLDTSTGTPAESSRFTTQKLGQLGFAYTYRGKPRDVEIKIKDEATGKEKTIIYHVEPNMPLPQEVSDKLGEEGVALEAAPYLINPAAYPKTAEELAKMQFNEKDISVLNWTGQFNKTLITPFEGQYKKSIYDMLVGKGVDIKPLEEYLDKLHKELNPKEIEL